MIINWTSTKFISGFILILLISLVVLVYFSVNKNIDDIDPIDNLAEEQILD